MACPCGVEVEQPWRTRNAAFSPASVIGGFVVIAFGTVALAAGLRPWVGWLVFGLLGALIVGAGVVQARRGHRGWCLVRRAVWFGLAIPGAPVRVLVTLP